MVVPNGKKSMKTVTLKMEKRTKVRIINSVAPIRICDLGGWTDTWFAKHGTVLNLGVYPYVQCQMTVKPATQRKSRFTIHAENYGDRYSINPNAVELTGKHPLLDACVAAMDVPDNVDIEVNLYSSVPGGSSTGTSAAITVALIGALNVFSKGRMTPYEIARKAHEVETDHLHLQSGIQDQLASVYGGISYIQMHSYPHASVSRIDIPNSVWWELESRLSLIYLGRPHVSSDIHKAVIQSLENRDKRRTCTLEALRHVAERGRDALYAGDIAAFGKAMIANTEAQQELHPALVSSAAHEVIAVAKRFKAQGWKVNGAGGEGGSLTLLASADRPRHREMLRAIEALSPDLRIIPTYLSRYGLRVWES